MSERTAKLRLGGFVAAGLAGLAGLAMMFGGAPRIFDNRAQFTVTFSEAPGISPGTPVRKSGVRVGEVTSLDLEENTGQVRVSIVVDKKYLPRQNEEATIFRGILSGDTSLDFIPKVTADGLPVTTRGEAYAINAEIAGQTPINPNTLVRQASGVLPSAQESMVRILNSIERVEKVIPKVERAFDEIAEFAKSGRDFVPELRETNKKVQSLISFNDPPAANPANPAVPRPDEKGDATLRSTLADIRDFLKATKPLVDDVRKVLKDNEADLAGTLKSVRKTAEGVNEVLSEENRKNIAVILKNLETASDDLTKGIRVATIFLDQGEKTLKVAETTFKGAEGAIKNIETATKPLAENADLIMKNVNLTADQLAKALAEVRETLRIVNRSDGTLQKVLNDPALYNQLNDSAVSLTRTLMRAEKIAADLQVFADKIARRPETIGIGGAIRPSAGLKESPSAATRERPILPTPLSDIPPAGPVVPSYRTPLAPRSGDLPPK